MTKVLLGTCTCAGRNAQPTASVDAEPVAYLYEGDALYDIYTEQRPGLVAGGLTEIPLYTEAQMQARADAARREALEEAEWVPLSQDDAETELWLCLRDMFHPTDDKSLIAEMRKRSLWVYARADRTADEDEENPNAG